MNLPGLDLHELRGARKGAWAVKVSGNWRVTFAFPEEPFDPFVPKPLDRHADQCNLCGYGLQSARRSIPDTSASAV